MEFLEFSLDSFYDESLQLAKLVERSGWRPDCVAYLAKGAWQIGEACGEFFNAPIIELSAHRSGESAKNGAQGLLRVLPRSFRRVLREFELRKRFEKADGAVQRKSIQLTERFALPTDIRRLLIVDDAADTGSSLFAARDLINGLLPKAEVKTAVITSFPPARDSGIVNFTLHKDSLLCSPMSKDNRDYSVALSRYEKMGAPCNSVKFNNWKDA